MLFFGGLFLLHKRATTHEAEGTVVVVGGGGVCATICSCDAR